MVFIRVVISLHQKLSSFIRKSSPAKRINLQSHLFVHFIVLVLGSYNASIFPALTTYRQCEIKSTISYAVNIHTQITLLQYFVLVDVDHTAHSV